MGKPTGFLEFKRQNPVRRPVELRLRDWHEVYVPQAKDETEHQAARCMDCGIPFCHQGCPLGNLIPEWNDLVFKNDFEEALIRLHATNNFPEFTGRLCPAPCESACVLGIADDPVTIERVEYEIIERGFAEGWVKPEIAPLATGKKVAVIGSGPAGLAAAQQLARAGHAVSVFERQEAIGGLLRFGIPEFKMEKVILDRRLEQMELEGVLFHTGVDVGATGQPSIDDLRQEFDAVLLALGSTIPRTLNVEGADLPGIMPAMTYLKVANIEYDKPSSSDYNAAGRHVIIIGGGDTGADCLGTALRQGAASVLQLEIQPEPPQKRPRTQPWPTMPLLFKVTSAHEEGGARRYAVATQRFIAGPDGRVRHLELAEAANPSNTELLDAELVLLAAGFIGPELDASDFSSLPTTAQGTLRVRSNWHLDDERSGVFACGDAVRGQSLIVWAIAEGRSAAVAVNAFLEGPIELATAPLEPYATSW